MSIALPQVGLKIGMCFDGCCACLAGQSTTLPEVALLKKAIMDKSVPGGQLLSAIISIEKRKLDVSADSVLLHNLHDSQIVLQCLS